MLKVQPLRDVFESLHDPLANSRYRQPLGRTLTLVFLAVVSGENSERGVADWIEDQSWHLKKVFGYRRNDVPCRSRIRRALAVVDKAELEQKLETWARQVEEADGGVPWAGVAVDGKKLRGAEAAGQAALDVLNAFSHQLGVVLGERLVGSKTNEIPAIIRLLEDLTLDGKLVTVDALHTQVKTAQAIVEKGGPT